MFAIKYLNKLGFSATNELFEQNAWYFRNSLVKANYSSIREGIPAKRTYPYAFFDNLLFGDKNELKSRKVNLYWNEEKQNFSGCDENGVPRTNAETVNKTVKQV